MHMPQFQQLNNGWNADPNAPYPSVRVDSADIVLMFRLNHWLFRVSADAGLGVLRFAQCRRYRLGATNDEGWYRGQCRFSKLAPKWGEFYEITGDLRLDKYLDDDWIVVDAANGGTRHFLFYMRDDTFECDALDWSFAVTNSARDRA